MGRQTDATAIETDQHLAQCIIYIDLNMIRAGEVTHPGDWVTNGQLKFKIPNKDIALLILIV